jgi:hypothetical protein
MGQCLRLCGDKTRDQSIGIFPRHLPCPPGITGGAGRRRADTIGNPPAPGWAKPHGIRRGKDRRFDRGQIGLEERFNTNQRGADRNNTIAASGRQ